MHYRTTPESFWRGAVRVGPCLEWQGSSYRRGYGKVWYLGLPWATHRLAWTLRHGPVPAGLCVCHTCDNPRCIEPLHLFLGTMADNMRDRNAKGRQGLQFHAKGRQGPHVHDRGSLRASAKVTETQVREMREAALMGVSRRELGRRYGVAHQTVTKIVNRQKWAHLT